MSDRASSASIATIATIATELYALPPDEFTAARNARARQLDGAAADAVREFAKPSAAASAVNVFSRSHTKQLEQLFELGELLREAQDDADREALRTLSSQRRALIAAFARQAADGYAGKVAPSALLQIEQTFQAAMADSDAAAAVASGRLIRSLASDGLGPVDLEGAVAGPLEGVQLPARRKPADLAAKRAEVAARKAREEAQRLSRVAEKALDAATAVEARAERRRDELADEVDTLVERLADLKAGLADASREAASARRARTTAEKAAEEARARLDDLAE